jgi:hypothetical protein
MNKKNFKKNIYLKRTCKTHNLDHKTVIKFLYIKKIDELKQYLPKSNMNKIIFFFKKLLSRKDM